MNPFEQMVAEDRGIKKRVKKKYYPRWKASKVDKPAGKRSNYTGVTWYAPRQCWRSAIKVDGETVHILYTADKLDAVKARDDYIVKHGLKNKLQHPDSK